MADEMFTSEVEPVGLADLVISPRQVAALLGMKVHTVTALAVAGTIPCSKTMKGQNRFKVRDVVEYMRQRQSEREQLTNEMRVQVERLQMLVESTAIPQKAVPLSSESFSELSPSGDDGCSSWDDTPMGCGV